MVKLMSFWGDVPCKILVQLAGFHQNRPCIPESPAKLKRSRTIPSCENHRLVVEKIHEVRKAANTQDGSAKVLRGFRAKGSTGLRRSPKKKCTDLAVLVRSSHARETAISETQSSNREWCWAMGIRLALWAVAKANICHLQLVIEATAPEPIRQKKKCERPIDNERGHTLLIENVLGAIPM